MPASTSAAATASHANASGPRPARPDAVMPTPATHVDVTCAASLRPTSTGVWGLPEPPIAPHAMRGRGNDGASDGPVEARPVRRADLPLGDLPVRRARQ